MDRLHSLYQHWSWLPHFRAIAETQHLGAAARLLHLTPPALSRALSHLEGSLGTKLFERRGRNLVLNDAGAELLAAVRTAMRHLDDAVQNVATTRQVAHLKVSAPGPYNPAVVLPALARARQAWPDLRVELVDVPASVALALTRGEVDLCLHEHAVTSAGIVVDSISKLQKVVACARSHPAARRRHLAAEDLLAYEFVAPPASDEGIRNDEWPADVERRVGLTVANMQLGVDAAAGGSFLAVLPRPIVTGMGLVALEVRGLAIPPTQIYASRRRPLATTSDATPRLIKLLRDELGRLNRKRSVKRNGQ